jgi:succinate dehydrogenase/fumarate reductase cytochrome b subunit
VTIAAMPKELLQEARWVRGQAFSGLVFGAFLSLHLANAAAGALGPSAYDGVLARVRLVYQFPLFEALAVAAAAAVHASYGIRRWRARRRRARAGARTAAPRWLRLHRVSGWLLLVALPGHALATRGPGLFLELPADFSFLRFSLETWPWFMVPYYIALYSAGIYHLLHGALLALRVLGLSVPAPSALFVRALLCVALAVGGAAVASMAGASGPADTSRYSAFRALYEEYAPFMVTW